MPRSGPQGTATPPPGLIPKNPGDVIPSGGWNGGFADVYDILNTPQPGTYGGTGAATLAGGYDNLSVKATDIASAATTDIGAASGRLVHITGTATITSLGTKTAGVERELVFDGIVTLTHNATSLILPGGQNIVTAANDTAIVVSEGSGNWRVIGYQRAAAPPVRSQAWELISTQSPSAQAAVDFTGLGAYRRLRLTGILVPANNAVGLFLRTSTDNGSSYDNGAGAYAWQIDRGTGSTASATSSASATEALVSASNAGNGAANGVQFEIILDQFNQTDYCWITGRSAVRNISDDFYTGTLFAQRLNTTARNALRLAFGVGNIASGYVTLEGIRS